MDRTVPQVTELIGKFAKKGLTPSQIGVLLRDSHGVAQVKSVTGSKILRILKGQGTWGITRWGACPEPLSWSEQPAGALRPGSLASGAGQAPLLPARVHCMPI